ncbi:MULTISPECIES: hypothetical protein [unclassified Pseudomonas]|uniref:hypothetical protein n=1 Tax=unclassified Pseudomonas TaxID=196821 RepID=UPI001CBB0937|nr:MULTISPECIES: hypothetical protein [unclassified Pseudomonas]
MEKLIETTEGCDSSAEMRIAGVCDPAVKRACAMLDAQTIRRKIDSVDEMIEVSVGGNRRGYRTNQFQKDLLESVREMNKSRISLIAQGKP